MEKKKNSVHTEFAIKFIECVPTIQQNNNFL